MINPDIQPYKPFDPGVTPSGGLTVQQGQQETNGQLDQEMKQSADQWFDNFYNSLDRGTQIALAMAHEPGSKKLPTFWSSIMAQALQQGLSANDVYYLTSKYGQELTPEFEKYLNNVMAQENTKTEFNNELYARDTSITSTLNQLRDNQMSSGLLSSLGGASAGISTSAAASDMSNVSQGRKMAEFNRKTQMARTMVGLLGRMASAGIYGSSIYAARRSVASLASAASTDALGSLKAKAPRNNKISDRKWNKLIQEFDY